MEVLLYHCMFENRSTSRKLLAGRAISSRTLQVVCVVLYQHKLFLDRTHNLFDSSRKQERKTQNTHIFVWLCVPFAMEVKDRF